LGKFKNLASARPSRMPPDRQMLLAWRMRLADLRAPACGMAHEGVRSGADAKPLPNPLSPTGYARTGLCPEAVRAGHIGCSHTMARHLLRDALDAMPESDNEPLLRELNALENAVSLLDHRRYDAETRHARAVERGDAAEAAAAQRAIGELVGEHRGYTGRALALRDAVLTHLDSALVPPDAPAQSI
jgi:hypothetical protein